MKHERRDATVYKKGIKFDISTVNISIKKIPRVNYMAVELTYRRVTGLIRPFFGHKVSKPPSGKCPSVLPSQGHIVGISRKSCHFHGYTNSLLFGACKAISTLGN